MASFATVCPVPPAATGRRCAAHRQRSPRAPKRSSLLLHAGNAGGDTQVLHVAPGMHVAPARACTFAGRASTSPSGGSGSRGFGVNACWRGAGGAALTLTCSRRRTTGAGQLGTPPVRATPTTTEATEVDADADVVEATAGTIDASSSSVATDHSLSVGQTADPAPPSRTVVVGGGPTGLAAAIMLARRGWRNIEVWERLQRPPAPTALEWGDPNRSYCIGISGRGQIALERLGCVERVLEYCKEVNGRMDWSPQTGPEGQERISNKKYATQVIQRDRLVSCLLEEVEEKYAGVITVMHGVAATDVEWLPRGGAVLTRTTTTGPAGVTCEDGGETGTRVTVPFVVGAEGATRRNAVMRAMDEDDGEACATKMVRFPDTNPRVYKTIPIKLPASYRSDLNYSARTKDGVALEALPTKEGLLVGILLVKPGDAKTCAKLESKESLRAYFDEDFPMFTKYVSDEDLELMAGRRLSTLPTFAYAGGNCLHRVASDKIAGETGEDEVGGACLLGDSIHTVKPYFGLGVNSAFEDVTILDDCLTAAVALPAGGSEAGAWAKALPEFSKRRAADAKALVDISRGFDGGFLTFVLPLILDGIFHKLAPALFMPNTIQMLQKQDWTFSDVAKRKRRDRVAQIGIIGSILGCVGWLVCAALKALVPLVMRAVAGGGAA